MTAIVRMYIDLITAPGSTYTVDRVPPRWRAQVQEELDKLENGEQG